MSAEMKRSAIIEGIRNRNLPQYIYKYIDENTIKYNRLTMLNNA